MRAAAEVLRVYDAGDKASCFLEFMVPRATKQGEYRIELWKFNEKLAWEADFATWVHTEPNSETVTLVRGSEYDQGRGMPRVGESVQLSQVDWRRGGQELPERNEYTVCAVSGNTLTLDRPYLGMPAEGARQMLRRVRSNGNILFVQREVVPRMATVNSSKWRPCEFLHTRKVEYAPAEEHEATLSGLLRFFPGRGRGWKRSSSYIDRRTDLLLHGLILVLRVECAEMEEDRDGKVKKPGAWQFFVGCVVGGGS